MRQDGLDFVHSFTIAENRGFGFGCRNRHVLNHCEKVVVISVAIASPLCNFNLVVKTFESFCADIMSCMRNQSWQPFLFKLCNNKCQPAI